jgi:hypothetical protein
MRNEVTINVNDHHRNNEDIENLHWLQCNVDYFKTRNGILKLIQLVSISRFILIVLKVLILIMQC